MTREHGTPGKKRGWSITETKRSTANLKLRQEREWRGRAWRDPAEQPGTTLLNVGHRERGLSVPGLYLRQKVSDVFSRGVPPNLA